MRDDDGVPFGTSRRSKEEACHYWASEGGRIFATFFVARRSCTLQVHIAPRVANLAKIRSVKLVIYVKEGPEPGFLF
jgi:hypothetical protein